MGYEREDAIYALRVTGNNIEHACSYLISNPNPSRRQAEAPMRIGLSSLLGGGRSASSSSSAATGNRFGPASGSGGGPSTIQFL